MKDSDFIAVGQRKDLFEVDGNKSYFAGTSGSCMRSSVNDLVRRTFFLRLVFSRNNVVISFNEVVREQMKLENLFMLTYVTNGTFESWWFQIYSSFKR